MPQLSTKANIVLAHKEKTTKVRVEWHREIECSDKVNEYISSVHCTHIHKCVIMQTKNVMCSTTQSQPKIITQHSGFI